MRAGGCKARLKIVRAACTRGAQSSVLLCRVKPAQDRVATLRPHLANGSRQATVLAHAALALSESDLYFQNAVQCTHCTHAHRKAWAES